MRDSRCGTRIRAVSLCMGIIGGSLSSCTRAHSPPIVANRPTRSYNRRSLQALTTSCRHCFERSTFKTRGRPALRQSLFREIHVQNSRTPYGLRQKVPLPVTAAVPPFTIPISSNIAGTGQPMAQSRNMEMTFPMASPHTRAIRCPSTRCQ
jgi:hypothetical protein